jgi:hypothetical protein
MKLKNFIKKINSGGLNAKEIQDIKKIDHQKVIKDYIKWSKKRYTINNNVLFIIAILSIAGGIFINSWIFLIRNY